MNPDPDFHPLASAWLDGTATPPEQQLLGEILRNSPDMMREYAALCRTEVLLSQCARSAAARRAALGTLLRGPSWPRRVTGVWNVRSVRWTAAAAALAVGAWALWPARSPDQQEARDRSAKKRPVQPMALPPSLAENRAPEATLPPAADGLERHLRRCYVADFTASGSLPEAVARLAESVKLEDTPPLTADVRSPGDAAVHLRLGSALPAWTVLEMMAVQTGTEFRLSGHNLVFLPAARPVPVSGSLTKTANYASLRSFLGLRKTAATQAGETEAPEQGDEGEEDPDEEEEAPPARPPEDPADVPLILEALTGEALGAPLSFDLPEGSAVKYTGGPRTVRTLELALGVPARAAFEVEFRLQALSLPKEAFAEIVKELTGDPDTDTFRLSLTGDQVQQVTQKASGRRGVDLMTMPVARGPANETLQSSVRGQAHEGTGVFAKFEGLVGSKGELDLSYDITVSTWDEEAQSILSVEDTGNVSIMSGATLFVPGGAAPDGKEIIYLITGNVFRGDGIPPEVTPEPPTEFFPAPEPAAGEELPYGIPVAGQKGKVMSPYAPDKGQVDVDGYKRGTRVECPYSGKHFRVP